MCRFAFFWEVVFSGTLPELDQVTPGDCSSLVLRVATITAAGVRCMTRKEQPNWAECIG